MAYLVLCPTCGGKMSSNALTCPHCGETDFFEPEMGWFSEPCRYEDLLHYALGCEGKGFLCRTQIWGNYGLHTQQEIRAMGIAPAKCVVLGNGLYVSTDDAALRQRIAQAAARGDVHVKFSDRYQQELFLEKVRCPRCKGTGKVTVRRPTGNYIDTRKRL